MHARNMEPDAPIQDAYPEEVAHCYGCGYLNPAGLQLKSRVEGDETVASFTPRPEHVALPGFVYGGLIASLIDCHGTGTAAWAGGSDGVPARFVTGTLEVKYLHPTPLGPPLFLRGRVVEKTGKKIVVEVTVKAEGVITAVGRVVAVRLPISMSGGSDA